MRPPLGTAARLAALLCSAALLVACADAEVPAVTSPPDDLQGEWRFTGGDGLDGLAIAIVEDHRPSLTIDGQRWRGQVCNTYDTTVDIDGTRVSFDPVSRTEMGCPQPGVMEAEAAYLDAFDRVDGFEVDGDELRLRGDGGVALRYARVETATDEPLVGTSWVLESLVDGSASDAAVTEAVEPAQLLFREDGTLRGSSGCRGLSGPFYLDGPLLDLTQVAIDDHDCDDERLAAQDGHVEATLLSGTAIRVEIAGNRLALTAPTGPALHYRAG